MYTTYMEANDFAILRSSRLFAALSDAALTAALDLLKAGEETFARNAMVHQAGEPMQRFGFVLAGTAQVYMDDINGSQMMLANATAGGSFGESLHFLQLCHPVLYIVAATPLRVLWLSADALRDPCSDAFTIELAQRFFALLAQRTLEMNDRIQILSRLTIREKLVAFFSQCVSRSGKNEFIVPFDRAGMAAYLGVNRAALSRELGKLQKQGLIAFRHDHFRILR